MASQTVKTGLKAKKRSRCPNFSFYKNSQSWSRVMMMWHFRVQIDPFVLNNFFKYKTFLLLSFTHWPFSLCKFVPVDPGLCGCAMFGPKMAYFPKLNFFQKKLLSLVSFIDAYLHTKNQSQILIYKWNIEISLANGHFWL